MEFVRQRQLGIPPEPEGGAGVRLSFVVPGSEAAVVRRFPEDTPTSTMYDFVESIPYAPLFVTVLQKYPSRSIPLASEEPATLGLPITIQQALRMLNPRPGLALQSMAMVVASAVDDWVCAICLDGQHAVFVRTVQCGHRFCSLCLETWRRDQHRCPVCRAIINNVRTSLGPSTL